MNTKRTEGLKKKLKQILEVYKTEKDACWFDGNKCPFGTPNGKLTEAPLRWCTKCQTVRNNSQVLGEFLMRAEIEEEIEEEIKRENTEEIKQELENCSENLKELLLEFANGDEISENLINLLDKYLEFGEVRVIRKEKISDL